MKKSLLALAVLGAFAGAAQAQSSVTIYGIVDTGVTYTSKAVDASGTGTGSRFQLNSGVIQGSRIGFKGTEDLGGGLSAVFNLEAGFTNDNGGLQGSDANTPANLFRRKSVVGLSGAFGTVLAGRQTDMLDDIGGTMTAVADFGGVIQTVGSNLNRLQGVRTNNSIRYNTNNLSGFQASAIYGFGEQAGQTSAGQAFGAGLRYTNGPLDLAAAYYQSKRAAAASNATAADTSLIAAYGATTVANTAYSNGSSGDTAVKTFTLAAAYQFGPAKLYGNWSRSKQPGAAAAPAAVVAANSFTSTGTNFLVGGANNDKVDAYEIGGNYALTPSLKLLAAVEYSKLSFINATNGKLTQYNLGTDYWLSKRTDVYTFVSYLTARDTYNPGIGQSGASGRDNNQAAVTVGIRHKF